MSDQYLIHYSLIEAPNPGSGYQRFELDVIKKIYSTWGAEACRKYIPWRSVDSIHKRAEKLKVKKVGINGVVRVNRAWSSEEQNIINKHHAETNDQIHIRLKKIGCDKTDYAISTRIGETRTKLNVKKQSRKHWPNDAKLLLAKNIKCNPSEIVKILNKAGFDYHKEAIKRARRRMLNNYVDTLNHPKGGTITPLDHLVKTKSVSGVTLNGKPLTISNGGLIETTEGYEITETVKPGDSLIFS